MIKLEPVEYALAGNLAEKLDFHLALRALRNGDSPGEIYLDNKDSPGTLFALTMKRAYLVGGTKNPDFNQALGSIVLTDIFPRGIARAEPGFSLFYSPGAWEQVIPLEILAGIFPRNEHYYLRCRKISRNWEQVFPAGYELEVVDHALVENDKLENHADLIEEIHSECSSTAEFLEKRFGYCVLQGDKIITWCLSEYNSAGRCEVGIATHPDHRLKLIRNMVREYECDGVLFHSDRSCKPYSVGQLELRQRLVAEGIPSLVLEADHADPRAYADGQAETRLRAFMETISG